MNESEQARQKKRRRLPWVVAAVLLVLSVAAVWDILEGPTLHASRPLPAMPAGTLAENLARLEGAVPGEASWPLLQEILYELVEPASPELPGPGASAKVIADTLQYLEDNRALLPRLHEAGDRFWLGRPMDLVEHWEDQRDFLQAKGDTAGVAEAEKQLAAAKAAPFRNLTPRSSNLLDFGNLVNLLVLSSREHREAGRPAEALVDLEAALGLGLQTARRPLILEQMIASSLIWTVQAEFRALLMEAKDTWSAADLERLAGSPLVQVPAIRPLRDLVLGEWWMALNIIEFVFQPGGSSTSILKDLTSLGGSSSGWRVSDLSLALHANRENTLRMMGAIHDGLLGMETMTPEERRDYVIPESILPTGFLANSRYALPRMMSSPDIYRSVLNAEASNHLNAQVSQVVLALLRHRAVQGDWPATLEALVPEFLDFLPVDHETRLPLIYELTENGPRLASPVAGGISDRRFLPIDQATR